MHWVYDSWLAILNGRERSLIFLHIASCAYLWTFCSWSRLGSSFMILFYNPHTWKSSMSTTCTVYLKMSTTEQHENHHLTLPWVSWTWLWEESVSIHCSHTHTPPCSMWDYMYSHFFFQWPCHYVHFLYTDSETHFKVVVMSEMFEGMPLLKVCRVQNHCLILRPRFQFWLLAVSKNYKW